MFRKFWELREKWRAFVAVQKQGRLKFPKSETMVSDIGKSPLLALIHAQKNPRKTRNIARARSLQIRSLLKQNDYGAKLWGG
jgi:hypothetical protein